MGQGEKKVTAKEEVRTNAKIKKQILTQGKHHKQATIVKKKGTKAEQQLSAAIGRNIESIMAARLVHDGGTLALIEKPKNVDEYVKGGVRLSARAHRDVANSNAARKRRMDKDRKLKEGVETEKEIMIKRLGLDDEKKKGAKRPRAARDGDDGEIVPLSHSHPDFKKYLSDEEDDDEDNEDENHNQDDDSDDVDDDDDDDVDDDGDDDVEADDGGEEEAEGAQGQKSDGESKKTIDDDNDVSKKENKRDPSKKENTSKLKTKSSSPLSSSSVSSSASSSSSSSSVGSIVGGVNDVGSNDVGSNDVPLHRGRLRSQLDLLKAQMANANKAKAKSKAEQEAKHKSRAKAIATGSPSPLPSPSPSPSSSHKKKKTK